MTDAIKAMELLEVAEKWLEPFGVTDPFSKLRLEGYLSLKPDYRYGALALLKVGGQEAPQRSGKQGVTGGADGRQQNEGDAEDPQLWQRRMRGADELRQ